VKKLDLRNFGFHRFPITQFTFKIDQVIGISETSQFPFPTMRIITSDEIQKKTSIKSHPNKSHSTDPQTMQNMLIIVVVVVAVALNFQNQDPSLSNHLHL